MQRFRAYKRGETNQFYYQKADSTYIPLVYKRYIDGNGQTATNFGFRQQLLSGFSCERVTKTQIERTLYCETDLTRFFVAAHIASLRDLQVPHGRTRTEMPF
ncbi:hypothetical protein GCM10010967_29440 [Dyadobacter beijingensis]|uniref:Uncharacterized protein n=1 Tax=Dyadobacter beijingensis TaxID=365489 RepID=A0ABQ2HZP1_9BACT|nr:hypothetical protein [Dyadobacter beijingensis]GGM94319.1 hypothetical protein GCM10010967_29440 [Dyadobacter beijingensis]